jgi:hypothetical protein
MTSFLTDAEARTVERQTKIRMTAFRILKLRREAALAQEALERAEGKFKEQSEEFGIDRVDLPEATIQVVSGSRRAVDADRLSGLITPEVFFRVTKCSVEMKKFDAAVLNGDIPEITAALVTTGTPYQSVRVSVH